MGDVRLSGLGVDHRGLVRKRELVFEDDAGLVEEAGPEVGGRGGSARELECARRSLVVFLQAEELGEGARSLEMAGRRGDRRIEELDRLVQLLLRSQRLRCPKRCLCAL